MRAFGHDQYEEKKYGDLVTRVQEMTEKEARAQSTLFSFNPFMGNMLLVYILMTSVPYIQAGIISPGDVTGNTFLILNFFQTTIQGQIK